MFDLDKITCYEWAKTPKRVKTIFFLKIKLFFYMNTMIYDVLIAVSE